VTAPSNVSPSAGNYYRSGIFNERRRYVGALAQRSELGRPAYVVSTDFYDWSRIIEANAQRMGQLMLSGVVGADAWKIEVAAVPAGNFNLKGGSGTAETSARALVGGYLARLFEDVDYRCNLPGPFSTVMADQIHRQYTTAIGAVLTDDRAKWKVVAGVGALATAGLSCVIAETGVAYPITANTETTLTLGGGFNAALLTGSPRHYYIELKTLAADRDCDVYLDVHVEDWGATEDGYLNHNPGGTLLESMRRRKLIQQVWVEQVDAEQPTADYVDLGGVQHYVLKLGTITRVAWQANVVLGDIDNDREENGGSAIEVVTARDYIVPCADSAVSLWERLGAEETYVTVGNGLTNLGMFTGPQGFVDALLCGAKTIFVKNGQYAFNTITVPGTVMIPDGVRVVGESREDTILLLDESIAGSNLELLANASLENLTVRRSSGAVTLNLGVLLTGPNARVSHCQFTDATYKGTCVRLLDGNNVVEGCSFTKTNGIAIQLGDGSVRGAADLSEVWGAQVRGCSISITSATLSGGADTPDFPAVFLDGIVSGSFCDNTVITNGQALRVDGDFSQPLTRNDQGGVKISGNQFLLRDNQDLTGYYFVQLGPVNVEFSSNLVDKLGNVDSPHWLYGVRIMSDPGTLHSGLVRVEGNVIRGCAYGVSYSSTLAKYAQIHIKGNSILAPGPDGGPTTGMSYGIWLRTPTGDSSATQSNVRVEDNYIALGEDAVCGILLTGRGVVCGNVIEGYGTETAADGIQVRGAGPHFVEQNFISSSARYGIFVDASTGEGVIAHNVVLGHNSLDEGVHFESYNGHYEVLENFINGCTYGLHCIGAGAVEGDVVVLRNTLEDVGAGIHGFLHVLDNNIRSTGNSVYLNLAKDAGSYARILGNRGNGQFYLSGLRLVEVLDNEFSGWLHPDYDQTVDVAFTIDDCYEVVARRNVIRLNQGIGKQGWGFNITDSGTVAVEANEISTENYGAGSDDFGGVGIRVADAGALSGPVLVRNNRVAFQSPTNATSPYGCGIHITRVAGDGDVQVEDNHVTAGSEGTDAYAAHTHSIYVSGADGIRVNRNHVEYGIHVSSSSVSEAATEVRDNLCIYRGICVDSGLSPLIKNNHVRIVQTVAAWNAVDRSGIWVGNTDKQIDSNALALLDSLEDNAGAVVVGNTIDTLPPGGTNGGNPDVAFSSAGGGGGDGRAAGIVIRSNRCTAKDNVLRHSSNSARLGMLIGIFDYVALGVAASAEEVRLGVGGRIVVSGNVFSHDSQLVVVLASAAQATAEGWEGRGTLKLQGNNWKFSAQDLFGGFVLHDVGAHDANDNASLAASGNDMFYYHGSVPALLTQCGQLVTSDNAGAGTGFGVVPYPVAASLTTQNLVQYTPYDL